MGSKVDRGLKAVATGGISEIDESGLLKTGRSSAERAQKAQSKSIAKQKQLTEIQLAEKEDEIGRRKALAGSKRGGRSSLITPSSNLSSNLGGS